MTVAEIDKEIQRVGREILNLQEQRPNPALEAERGDRRALADLDARIEKLKVRKETLADARVAVAWEQKRALEKECAPLVKEAGTQWKNVKRGLSALLTGLRQYSEAVEQVNEYRKRGVKMTALPTAELSVLAGVIKGLGLKPSSLPFINENTAGLEDEEQVFSAVLDEFETRAKTTPHAVRKRRPEDEATGGLAAMNSASAPRAARP